MGIKLRDRAQGPGFTPHHGLPARRRFAAFGTELHRSEANPGPGMPQNPRCLFYCPEMPRNILKCTEITEIY